MTFLTILAQIEAESGPIGDIAQQFGVDWWKFLSQCISFSIVAFVLQKYAYQPILKVLEERRTKIAEGLENAERSKKELAEARTNADAVIAKANGEATKMIDEARAAAKVVQERETQRAVAEAEQIISKAREAAKVEHAKMLAELKQQVSRLVIDTTTKVTGKILNAEDQKRLSDEAAKEIAA
ncbi:MAG: F0F1 ATP synthase subunit B [Chthoniobacteraceae bacterium]